MQRRKGNKKRNSNTFCFICGRFADTSCSFCKRHLCHRCARSWAGDKSGFFTTCAAPKCQHKLPPDAKRNPAGEIVKKVFRHFVDAT